MKCYSRLVITMALAVVSSTSGCGTFCNFGASIVRIDGDKQERPAVYGGVQFDLDVLAGRIEPIGRINLLQSENTPVTVNGPKSALFVLGLYAVVDTFVVVTAATELGMTFIADTLTLPITLPIEKDRAAKRPALTPPAYNTLSSYLPQLRPAQMEKVPSGSEN